jgi:GTP cyclohydrolase I
MITELKLKEVSEQLNNLSFEQVGDDHLFTGLLTPMKKDAFKLSDEEKKTQN